MSAAEHCLGRIMRKDGKVHGIFVIEHSGNFVFTAAFVEFFDSGRAKIKVRDRRVFLEIPFLGKAVEIFGSADDREELAAMLADTSITWFAFAKPLNLLEIQLIVGRKE